MARMYHGVAGACLPGKARRGRRRGRPRPVLRLVVWLAGYLCWCGPLYSNLDDGVSEPLAVPLTDEVVWAKVRSAWAVASDIWSRASRLRLSMSSQGEWYQGSNATPAWPPKSLASS